VPAQVSVASFVDLYLYTLIGLIPGINVWDTLHVTSAIQTKDRVAGAPILIFKIIVVFLLFDAIRTWLKRRQESTIALAVAATKAESVPVE
jgi:hypothetical protein